MWTTDNYDLIHTDIDAGSIEIESVVERPSKMTKLESFSRRDNDVRHGVPQVEGKKSMV